MDRSRSTPLQFELAASEAKEVKISVAVPADASSGGRFATIFFSTVPQAAVKTGKGAGFEGGSGFGAKIGTAFLLTVRGPLTLETALAKIVPVALGPGRIGFRVEAENSGKVHVILKGEIDLKDQDGNVIGQFTLPETTAVLPGSTRSYNFKGFVDVEPGDYQASGTLDYSWTGRQVEAAEVQADDWTDRTSSQEISFNSQPALEVTALDMELEGFEGDVRFTAELKNNGDVEVAPAGLIEVRNKKGELFVALNIGAGNIRVEPNSTITSEHLDTVNLPKDDYTVSARFEYFGQEPAQREISKTLAEDVIPAVAQAAPDVRRQQFQQDDGIPVWVWAVGGVAGVLVVLIIVFVGYRALGSRESV